MTGDLSEQLGKLLSDPAAMEQVMRIAGTLMQVESDDSTHRESYDSPQRQSGDSTQGESGDPPQRQSGDSTHRESGDSPQRQSGDSTQGESGDSPRTPSMPDLSALLGAFGNVADDPRTTLLHALKPYLSDARRERADLLIRALRLASIAEKFLLDQHPAKPSGLPSGTEGGK